MTDSDASHKKSQERLWGGMIGASVLGGLALYLFFWRPLGGWQINQDKSELLLAAGGCGFLGIVICIWTLQFWLLLRKSSRISGILIYAIGSVACANAVPLIALVVRIARHLTSQ